MKLESLRARLVLAALVWVMLATLLGGWALSYAFRKTAAETFETRLDSLVTTLIGAVEINASGAPELRRDPGEPRFDAIYSGWYWVVADERGPLLRSRSLWDMDLAIEHRAPSAEPAFSTQRDATGRELRVATQAVLLPGRDTPLTFVVSADAAVLAAEIQRFDLLLTVALSVLGIGLIAGMLVQVHFGLRPLQRVARQVEQVREGRAVELRPTGTRELDLLVDAVNSLIRHNQRLIERTRAHVADLAHSLKTPLAVLKADLPDDPQVASMERIIARRLSAAATAGPGQLSGTPIATVIDEILRGLGRVYADRRLEFRNEAPRSALAAVEREDLEEIAGSLLDNACKFARRTVRVALEPTGPGRGRLVVEDDGAGMSAEQAALAVDRGQRFDPAARGSGLGLAIVADIAEVYRGALELGRATLGGTRAAVEMPMRLN